MNQITIETKYTVEDYIRTETFLKNLKKPSTFIINLGGVVLYIAGLINMFIAYFAMKNGEFGKAFLLILITFGAFSLTVLLVVFYDIPWRLKLFKRNIKKNFDPDSIAYSERQIVFGEEGILETHKFGEYLTNWEAISDVIESNEDFFFYLHNTIRFIPKRDVSEEQIDPLRILIKANLTENSAFQLITTK